MDGFKRIPKVSYARINCCIARNVRRAKIFEETEKLTLLLGAKNVSCFIKEKIDPINTILLTNFLDRFLYVFYVWETCRVNGLGASVGVFKRFNNFFEIKFNCVLVITFVVAQKSCAEG